MGRKFQKEKQAIRSQPGGGANLEAQNRTNRLGSGGSAHSKLLDAASFLRGSRRGHHTPPYQAGSSGLPCPPPGVRANPAVRSAQAPARRTPSPRYPAETPAGEGTRSPTFVQPLSPTRHPRPECFTCFIFPSPWRPFLLSISSSSLSFRSSLNPRPMESPHFCCFLVASPSPCSRPPPSVSPLCPYIALPTPVVVTVPKAPISGPNHVSTPLNSLEQRYLTCTVPSTHPQVTLRLLPAGG